MHDSQLPWISELCLVIFSQYRFADVGLTPTLKLSIKQSFDTALLDKEPQGTFCCFVTLLKVLRLLH